MRHGSLFSGIGGFDLAAQWMEWDNVFHCEINPFSRSILNKQFPKSKSYEDITQFDATIYRGCIDILSGGFPCQDISIAKQLNGGGEGINGKRSGLWKEYARVVGEIRPQYIVFENSPMLVNRGFEQVLCDLSRMGYDAEWRNFFATQFGFNHRRKRTYGIAYAGSERFKDSVKQSGILRNVLSKQPPRQDIVPMPIKRFNAKSDFGSVQMYDGFPEELDRSSLTAYGNAIVPGIAYQIFKAIQLTLNNHFQCTP